MKMINMGSLFPYWLCLPLLIIFMKMINMGRPFPLLTMSSHVNLFYYRESRNVHFWHFFTNKKFSIHKIKIVGDKKLPILVPSESNFVIWKMLIIQNNPPEQAPVRPFHIWHYLQLQFCQELYRKMSKFAK